MIKRQEPTSLFKEGDEAFYGDTAVTILKVNTYCPCCSRFLDEVNYSVLGIDRSVDHKIKESHLKLTY